MKLKGGNPTCPTAMPKPAALCQPSPGHSQPSSRHPWLQLSKGSAPHCTREPRAGPGCARNHSVGRKGGGGWENSWRCGEGALPALQIRAPSVFAAWLFQGSEGGWEHSWGPCCWAAQDSSKARQRGRLARRGNAQLPLGEGLASADSTGCSWTRAARVATGLRGAPAPQGEPQESAQHGLLEGVGVLEAGRAGGLGLVMLALHALGWGGLRLTGEGLG